jgi:hypothetical protein
MLIAELSALFDKAGVPTANRKLCAQCLIRLILGISTYRPQRKAIKAAVGDSAESIIWAWTREIQWRRDYMTHYWRAFGRFVESHEERSAELLNVPVTDLWYMLDMVDRHDLEKFLSSSRDPMSIPVQDRRVANVLRVVRPQINLCARKLHFVTTSDPGHTEDDWVGMFTAEALKGIYRYDTHPEAYMINTVHSMLWKLLANLQRHHSFDKHSLMVRRVRADVEHDAPNQKRTYKDYEFIAIRSPLEIEMQNGHIVDVPACAGHFSECLIETDLDTEKLLNSVERISRKVAAYLRTVVYDDDDQGRFTDWLNVQPVNLEEMTDTQFDGLARKYYKVEASDLRDIRARLGDFDPKRLAHA